MITGLDVQKLIIEIHLILVKNQITVIGQDDHALEPQSDGSIMLSVYPSTPETAVIIDGKTQDDTVIVDGKILSDATVKFNRVWVNDILIENWAFAAFCNFYHQDSERDSQFQIGPDLTFYANGICRIDLDDFFHRYHRNLIASLYRFNDWVVNSHLGFVDPTDRSALQEIYNKICALKE